MWWLGPLAAAHQQSPPQWFRPPLPPKTGALLGRAVPFPTGGRQLDKVEDNVGSGAMVGDFGSGDSGLGHSLEGFTVYVPTGFNVHQTTGGFGPRRSVQSPTMLTQQLFSRKQPKDTPHPAPIANTEARRR